MMTSAAETFARRRMGVGWTLAVVTVLLFQVPASSVQFVHTTKCSVCRGLVGEISSRVSAVDPKEMLQVGSYRLDHKGNQNLVQVKYATSDAHLSEILDDVCESFRDYGLLQADHDDDVSVGGAVVRTKSRSSGKELDTRLVKRSPELRQMFKTHCGELVEEHEDDIMTIFKQDDTDAIEGQLCGEIAGVCTPEELSEPVPELSERSAAESSGAHTMHVTNPDGTQQSMGSTNSLDDMKQKIMEAVNNVAAGSSKKNVDDDDDDDSDDDEDSDDDDSDDDNSDSDDDDDDDDDGDDDDDDEFQKDEL